MALAPGAPAEGRAASGEQPAAAGAAPPHTCTRAENQWPGRPRLNARRGEGPPGQSRLDGLRASPGRQGAAQHMLHVPVAAAGEGVHAPTELPCHLWIWNPSAGLATQGPAKEGRMTRRDSRVPQRSVGQRQPRGVPHLGHQDLPLHAVELLGSDSLVAAVATDGGVEGDRAGETLHAKSHWGLQGQSPTCQTPLGAPGPRASPSTAAHQPRAPRPLL